VVGVTQPEFQSHIPIVPSDVYIPMTMFGVAQPGFDQFTSMQSSWVTAIGRLAPGASVDGVNSELKTLFTRLAQQYPEVYGDRQRSARVASLTGVPAAGHGPVTAFLGLLMGLVGLVLLTTCANVAGMMIARAAAREHEIAIRLAIGSGRWRLMRQLLIESLLVFVIGGAAGIIVSTWGLRAAAGFAPPAPVKINLDFSPDKTVFAFGLLVTLITGVLFGLAPALQSTNPSLVGSLKNEGNAGHSRGGRMRRAFVIAQVSLSLILLISAGLFLRSLQRASESRGCPDRPLRSCDRRL
jgi:putative ABC transport system permease protein